ncbi:MAG: hypothetical protein P4L00_08035, partial [Candidatus Acidoferrales bacterium]|nr:hypothetical protein [Candidatus Acidoferrales bacterium]
LQIVRQRVVELYLDHISAKRKTMIVSDASLGSKRPIRRSRMRPGWSGKSAKTFSRGESLVR